VKGRRLATVAEFYETDDPGVYVKVTSDDPEAIKKDRTTWWVRDPYGHVGRLDDHTVIEHEDGTITVSPSILDDAHPGGWHGFLERGVWRSA
jgi:hypothetical protein